MAERVRAEPFSEKGFYLSEFRGRTLAIAARAEQLGRREPLAALLEELEANDTRVVLVSTERGVVEDLAGAGALTSAAPRFEGEVWRALSRRPRVGIVAEEGEGFAPACREIVLRLGISKLVWVDPDGGLCRADGGRSSFVDLEELRRLLREPAAGPHTPRLALLREVELALSAGVAAVNLTSLEGLADELFTYAGAGTLFTRERYVEVRRLGLDDYDAADDLIARGVAEGYLAPRTAEEIERVLANGFGAFVEGCHLAGIGALLEHPAAGAGEISSLYTITRFLGEGIGGHLVRFASQRARERGFGFVFACTTAERVVGFFERQGFRRVEGDEIPAEKWRAYDPQRRPRLHCLRHDLTQR
jgi:N-acetylglutamate synthase-like GNAT family acetyltransferase